MDASCAILGSPFLIRMARITANAFGLIVFGSPKERRWLEKQIHPWVVRQLRAFIRKHRGLIAVDIPVAF